MKRPLEGVRILEMGQLIAGPFAAKMLAEFGADVIKMQSRDDFLPFRGAVARSHRSARSIAAARSTAYAWYRSVPRQTL
ncbi:CoA transferase family III [Trinickia symbiotica]|uniref:CoA transferase n=1 Tax=Trinickia symbiotica TaxID=863227 RepID=A0A2N7X509_9BURK|nr:hypothetical protein C0Z20_10800 [Trinickia symbiotica]PPK46013.1 CoA transferase family III [Trinickia symbiotica]